MALLCLTFSGCTINKVKHTSGIIGCPEQMIEITDSSGGFTANTWTAVCGGRTFYCTYRGLGNIVCAPSIVD
jgi:hypothetical protein